MPVLPYSQTHRANYLVCQNPGLPSGSSQSLKSSPCKSPSHWELTTESVGAFLADSLIETGEHKAFTGTSYWFPCTGSKRKTKSMQNGMAASQRTLSQRLKMRAKLNEACPLADKSITIRDAFYHPSDFSFLALPKGLHHTVTIPENLKTHGSSQSCFIPHISSTLQWYFAGIHGMPVTGFCQVLAEGEMYLLKKVIIMVLTYH